MMKLLLAAALIGLNAGNSLAQIIDYPNTASNTFNSNNLASPTNTYDSYNQVTESSPSLLEIEGAAESGSIQFTDPVAQNYNIQRVWQAGATPDQIAKVGDFTFDPNLSTLVEIDQLTLRTIAAEGNQKIDTVPLKSIGLINNLTLGEFLQAFPQLQDRFISDVTIIDRSIENLSQILNTDIDIDSDRFLEEAEKLLVENLAQNPAFENIPLADLLQGDWSKVITLEEQEILAQITTKFPELIQTPIDKLFPMVDGIIVGDWQNIVDEARQIALAEGREILTSDLLALIPELKDIPLSALPINDLSVGDIEGLEDLALGKIPNLADRYLSELGTLNEIPVSKIIDNTALQLFSALPTDIFGLLDIAYAGDTENPVTHVLSGGTKNQKFKPEPCYEQACKHFEITNLSGEGDLMGKAWVQGTSQKVEGGKGFLRSVAGGKERTGVSVWSTKSRIKMSLENIQEGDTDKRASADVWLNLQFCIRIPFGGLHCTPHFIPIPTPITVHEGDPMLVFSRSSPYTLLRESRENQSEDNE